MITIVHLLVGAAIGKSLGNLWFIIPIAIISHYILDFIPHSQFETVKKYKECGFWGCNKKDLMLKAIEPIIGIALTIYLSYLNAALFMPMIIGALFSFSPDIFIYFGTQHNSKLAKAIHLGKKSKWHKHTTIVKGAIAQIIISAIAAFIILT